MTTIHAEIIADKALLSRSEFEQLLELARRNEEVELIASHNDVPILGVMHLAMQGGSFDFLADDEDLYTAEDARVRYR